MKQHNVVRFSILGVLAGAAIAIAAPAAAQIVTTTCPLGSYVIPGGAYEGPGQLPIATVLNSFASFRPTGDLCVYPYDGPFGFSQRDAANFCTYGLLGDRTWRLPNARELYELITRNYHLNFGMVTIHGGFYRYWTGTDSSANKAYYVLKPSAYSPYGANALTSINSIGSGLSGVNVATRCVKAADVVVIPPPQPVVVLEPAEPAQPARSSRTTRQTRSRLTQ
ncbi:MAG: DUF1566 domain-containing protein [Azoarcus sp.]|jgi:hypothetical protein|nr:DUF1566 domain-containing protein [Azoarcus sp.]